MDRNTNEKELESILERTRKLIDDAYMCGYKDGYCECIRTKNKVKSETQNNKRVIQLSVSDI